MTHDSMTAILCAIDRGETLEEARARGLVTTDEAVEFWQETAVEIADIKARGLQVEIPHDALLDGEEGGTA